jgi:hypothetical protein
MSFTNFLIYDYNRNFGQAPWIETSGAQGTTLTTSFLNYTNDAGKNQPGALIGFSLRIFINKPVIASETRIKMILSAPFSFSDRATATVENDPRFAISGDDIYRAPNILRVSIDSPLELSVRFTENLPENKAFIISFTNIQNPSQLASSPVKLYSMVGNGESFIERNENVLTLQTLTNPIKVELGLASGAPLLIPAGFYKGHSQFVQVRINSQLDIPANNYIKIRFGAGNTALKGTAYIAETVPAYDSSLPIKFDYSSDLLTISNIGLIENSKTIVVVVRVRFALENPTLVVTATIDANVNAVTALYSGSTPSLSMITATDSMVTNVGGTGNAKSSTFVLNSGDQTFNLNLNPSSGQTAVGSTLKLVIPKQIRKSGGFSPTQSCKGYNGAVTSFPNCIFEERETYSYIEMRSPVTVNLIPSGGVNIQINNVAYSLFASDLTDNIWEVYGVLERDQDNAPSRSFFIVNVVVNKPITGVTSANIVLSMINKDYATAQPRYAPTFLSLVGKDTNAVTYSLGTNERRVITIFVKQGFKTLNAAQPSQASYPCSSTFQQVSCIYVEGDNIANLNDNHPIYWDRIHIYPSNDIINSMWRIILPYYLSNDALKITVAFGVENTVTRKIGATPTSLGSTLEAGFKTNMAIAFSGFSGTLNENVPFTVVTGNTNNGNTGSNYASAVVVAGSWQMWENGIGAVSDTGSGLVTGSLKDNSILSINWYDTVLGNMIYFTVIPVIKTTASEITATIKLKLFFPYQLDVPNYRVFYSDNLGQIRTWNSITNAGSNSFSANRLQTLQIDCDYKYDDFLNSNCQIIFQTVSRVEPQAKINAVFTGFIYRDSGCLMSYKSTLTALDITPLSSVSCSASGAGSTTVIASLNELNFSPAGYIYNLTVKGLDIGSSSIRKTLNLQVRDKTGGYVLEQDTITITTFGQNQGNYITVGSIAYGYNNPSAYSSLNFTFTLPRNMKDTERFEINLGEDISDVNPDMGSLQFVLYDPQFRSLLIYMQFSTSSSNIIVNFNDPEEFKAGPYTLIIKGIRLPAGNSNSLPKFYFRRLKDSNIVLENLASATAKYPTFNTIPLLGVALKQTRYNLEGHPMELNFDVTTSTTVVSSDSLLIIRFPFYFNTGLNNNLDEISCKVDGIIVGCRRSPNAPLQLEIFDFPTVIRRGQTFSLVVFGVLTPRRSSRYDVLAGRETIFLALDSNRNGTLSESIHILPPAVQTVGDSMSYTFLDDLQLVSNLIKTLTKHTLKVRSQRRIPAKGGLLVVFSNVYGSLMYLSELDCRITYSINGGAVTDFGMQKCQVSGKILKVYVPSDIPALASITWEIISVPTPNEPASVAMNSFLVSVFDTDDSTILARSFSGLNKASSVQFQLGKFGLDINDGKDILITRGTFSNVINIKTRDGSRFVNNIIVNSTTKGLYFEPSSFIVTIGDFGTSFRIGIDKDIKDGLYPLVFNKKETGFTSVYGKLLEIFVYVVSIPVKIPIPQYIDVRRRGCSSPSLITVGAAPNADITIRVRIDEYNEYLYMDPQHSSYSLWFDRKNPTNQIVVCLADTLPLDIGKLRIDLSITGTNAKSFILERNFITINVIETDQPKPQLVLEQWKVGRTDITFKIRAITEGFMYWRLIENNRLSSIGAPSNTFNDYKLIMKNNNFSNLVVANEFGESIEVFSYMPVYSFSRVNGTRFLNIDNLRPETTYNLYAFLLDTYGVTTDNFTTNTFTTDSNF